MTSFCCTWFVNDDGETVTFNHCQPGKTGTGNYWMKIDLSKEVKDFKTEKMYKVTEIGYGSSGIGMIKADTLITDNILRVNDRALDIYDDFHVQKLMSKTNRIQYFGNRQTGLFKEYGVDSLWFNDGCRIMNIGGYAPYTRIGNVPPMGDASDRYYGTVFNVRKKTTTPVRYTMECTSITPPEVNCPLFSADDEYRLTDLVVPDEAIDAYRAHSEWSKFTDIYTCSGYADHLASIETIFPAPTSAHTWSAAPGELTVSLASGAYVSVVGLSGTVVCGRHFEAGAHTFSLVPGVYILRVDDTKAEKILIR